jgi:hypothetical protein
MTAHRRDKEILENLELIEEGLSEGLDQNHD